MPESLTFIARERGRRRSVVTLLFSLARNNAAVNYLDLTTAVDTYHQGAGFPAGQFDPGALLRYTIKGAGAEVAVVVGGHLYTVVWSLNPAATSWANLLSFLIYDNTGTPVAVGVAVTGLLFLELTGPNGKL